MAFDELPPPYVYGLPERYAGWRVGQSDAILATEQSDRRFVLHAAPTGFGKSLAYVATALSMGIRTAIVTSTKGLQEQLMRDFKQVGLHDIRGMNAYPCVAAPQLGMPASTSCADAPCHAGFRCPLRNRGCLYYDAYEVARHPDSSPVAVVTNYAYWMHISKYGEGLGNFGLLVLDEAHDAPDSVVDFVGVNIDPRELGAVLDDARTPATDDSVVEWQQWVAERTEVTSALLSSITEATELDGSRGRPPDPRRVRRAIRLKSLLKKFEGAAQLTGDWVIEQQERIIRLDPIWPGRYAESVLFRGIPKVAMFSATLRPKIAYLLGIANGKFTFNEYPSSFSPARRPITHVPTVSVRYNSDDRELGTWINRIDQIVRSRSDRKGIIHCVSYARRDLLVSNSEFRRFMLHHNKENTAEVVAKFKRMQPPAILVSPSVMTGWDFPDDECRWQIIAKVPFPDFQSQIAKARDATDPEWSKYLTVMQLIQASGRGVRSETDWCETFIVDDNVEWLIRRHRNFAPGWWLEAYRSLRTIPPPLQVL